MRLIDADNLKKDLNVEFIFDSRDRCRVRNLIDFQLTIEAEPIRRGHWIDTGSGQECSVCHEIQYGYDNYRYYCPYCGAKMEENNG